jgi:hypothetical protein
VRFSKGVLRTKKNKNQYLAFHHRFIHFRDHIPVSAAKSCDAPCIKEHAFFGLKPLVGFEEFFAEKHFVETDFLEDLLTEFEHRLTIFNQDNECRKRLFSSQVKKGQNE